jgi:hypothetical protein
MTSSLLTMFCYFWLVLPPSMTKSPLPGIASFATGHGFSPRKRKFAIAISSRLIVDISVVLLVVLVPEIVASKYVSTTLGAHKAVSISSYLYVRMCPNLGYPQLEQAGSTIFTTLAGVALDIKSKKASAEAVAPINGDARDIQYLLNAFLILNVVQFAGLLGLSRLDRRRKHADARREAALLPPILEEDSSSTISSASLGKDENAWHRADPTATSLGSKSTSGTVRSVRGLTPASTTTTSKQSIPLLRSSSVSSATRSSKYLSFPNAPQTKVVRTKGELKRGEIFAVLSGLSIAFAWILFMTVAWLRLRSKEDRASQIGLTH